MTADNASTTTAAVRYSAYGDVDRLDLVEVPLPEPGPGQVRVRVRAAGLNPVDSKQRQGMFAEGPAPRQPSGVGIDFAGVVDAVGTGVRQWAVGQPVLGRSATNDAMAHYTLAAADDIVAKPDGVPFELAAVLPVASETAYRTLDELGLAAGQTLLVHAASGGVGLTAVQLARARGATVIGTASEANHDFLREIRAVPVTYGPGLAERVRAVAPQGVDAVLDAAGRDALPVSLELTGDPAKVVTIADPAASEYGVRFSGESLPLPPVMAEVLPLLADGALRIPIDAVFPLDRVWDAYRRLDTGHVRGKVVVTMPA
jgi:NADPH:quinone reductase-like Zn-dependent oxidoreductase